jgi:hypothetical protein
MSKEISGKTGEPVNMDAGKSIEPSEHSVRSPVVSPGQDNGVNSLVIIIFTFYSE